MTLLGAFPINLLPQIDLTTMIGIEDAEHPLESVKEIVQELEWVSERGRAACATRNQQCMSAAHFSFSFAL